MTAEHEYHGNTAQNWTAVTIIMIASLIGTVAVVIGNWSMFWIGGVGGVVLGLVVGKVMGMMGMGPSPEDATR
jgi:hypothetical protein